MWLKLFSKDMDESLIDETRLVTISRLMNNTGTVVWMRVKLINVFSFKKCQHGKSKEFSTV